jgi:hypothetical protein
LATLPDTQQQAFGRDNGFADPGYKTMGKRVVLRGVVKRTITNTNKPAFAPIVGVLPHPYRPLYDVTFPSLALDGIKLNLITVSTSGHVQVLFDANQEHVSLDGIEFVYWSEDSQLGNWQFSSTNDQTAQLVNIPAGRMQNHCMALCQPLSLRLDAVSGLTLAGVGRASHVFSAEGLMHTGRNGQAAAQLSHTNIGPGTSS